MPACYTLLVRYTQLVRELEGFCVEYAGTSQFIAPTVQGQSPRSSFTAELLDLVTLMPDHQLQQIVDYIAALRAARALREDAP